MDMGNIDLPQGYMLYRTMKISTKVSLEGAVPIRFLVGTLEVQKF